MKDYYRILEVEPISTHEVIKTNFRRLAKVYHPDISKSNLTADKFIEITEAYEVLSDATKRDKYNFYYNNAQNNQQDNESVFQEWENFGRQKAAEYAKCWVCGDNSNPEHSWFVSMQKDDEYTYVLLPHCTKCNKQLEKEQTRNKYLFIIFYFIIKNLSSCSHRPGQLRFFISMKIQLDYRYFLVFLLLRLATQFLTGL